MPGLLDSCEKVYGTRDLYEALAISRTATERELKRAYHKLSLKIHPDRVSEKEKAEANIKFQILSKIYVILSDKDKRTIYDDSGEIDDSGAIQETDWEVYWKMQFKKITLEDISNFESQYKGSEEELEDLKSAYSDYQGDMDKIMEHVLCCTYDDEARFTKILHDLISSGDIQSYTKFTKEPKKKKESRKKRFEQEAAEASEMLKEIGGGGDMTEDNLKQIIAKRQDERLSKIDEIEAKYVQPKNKRGKAAEKPGPKRNRKMEEAVAKTETSEASARPRRGKKVPSDADEIAQEAPVEAKGKVGKKGKKSDQEEEEEEVNDVETKKSRRGKKVDQVDENDENHEMDTKKPRRGKKVEQDDENDENHEMDTKKPRRGKKVEQDDENEENNHEVDTKKSRRGKKAENSDYEKPEPKANSRAKKVNSDEPKTKKSKKQKAEEETAAKLTEIEEELEEYVDDEEDFEIKPAAKKDTKKKAAPSDDKEVKGRASKKGASNADMNENETVEKKKVGSKNKDDDEAGETNSKPVKVNKATRGRAKK